MTPSAPHEAGSWKFRDVIGPMRAALAIMCVGLLILVILGLCAAGVQKVRGYPASAQSKNNLKQMVLSIDQMVSPTDHTMPPAIGTWPNGGPDASLFFHMLPGVEQDNVYKQYKNNPVDGPQNDLVTIKTYCAIADPTNPGVDVSLSSYASNAAVFGLEDGGTTRLSQLAQGRGTANYILFMERYAIVGGIRTHAWSGRGNLQNYLYPPINGVTDPAAIADPQFDVRAPISRNDAPHAFTRTIQVGMADGSARSFTSDVCRSFTYADGKTATVWAWACSLDGPLGKSPVPVGW